MSESEVQQVLIELRAVNTKLDHLTELYNRAAYGEGFNRCSKHSNRIKHLEDSVELAHSRISGVKKWLIGGLISIASMAINYAWSMIQNGRH